MEPILAGSGRATERRWLIMVLVANTVATTNTTAAEADLDLARWEAEGGRLSARTCGGRPDRQDLR